MNDALTALAIAKTKLDTQIQVVTVTKTEFVYPPYYCPIGATILDTCFSKPFMSKRWLSYMTKFVEHEETCETCQGVRALTG